ncbi:hypothetical protein KSP35_22025 [Aquihabitans sp. G128]|uniref:hypothetical protein n=1 Tax=Aquihabitans sp. G128 TaxID=2849779 RepID=UPI001C211A08|nr:hypothetical protein [Aquihabitans sp. G128]QXC60959.1 hypothetical protein KSP35_22025 [Aquihabitans sp. G128]
MATADGRRWRQRPIWWFLLVSLAGTLIVGSTVADRTSDRLLLAEPSISGHVLPSWDHGSRIPVRFRSRTDGRLRTAYAPVTDATPERIGPVSLVQDPDDPGRILIEDRPGGGGSGPDASATGVDEIFGTAALFLALDAVLVGWWLVRRRRIGVATRLLAGGPPAERVLAVPRPGRLRPRRWRVVLYPLDAAPGSPPTATVRVVGSDPDPAPREVDVWRTKPGGRDLALREVASGRAWFPAARARSKGSLPLPAPTDRPNLDRWSRAGAAVLALGLVLLVGGLAAQKDPIGELDARARPVTVTVAQPLTADEGDVVVTYRRGEHDRRARVHLAGPQRVGDRFRLLSDPRFAENLWQPNTEEPPVTDDNDGADLAITLGTLLTGIGVLAVRRPIHGADRRAARRAQRLATVGAPGAVHPFDQGAPTWGGWPASTAGSIPGHGSGPYLPIAGSAAASPYAPPPGSGPAPFDQQPFDQGGGAPAFTPAADGALLPPVPTWVAPPPPPPPTDEVAAEADDLAAEPVPALPEIEPLPPLPPLPPLAGPSADEPDLPDR